MALILATIAALVILLVTAVWLKNTLSSPQGGTIIAKTLVFLLAVGFTLGSGLCAVGSTILLQPVAILALAALAVCVYACKAILKWRQGQVSPIHPLAQFLVAAGLTIAAYVVAAFTIRLAG